MRELINELKEKLLEVQGGKCKLCEVHLDPNNRNTTLDHDHRSLRVRGVLCTRCNGLVSFVDASEKIVLGGTHPIAVSGEKTGYARYKIFKGDSDRFQKYLRYSTLPLSAEERKVVSEVFGLWTDGHHIKEG